MTTNPTTTTTSDARHSGPDARVERRARLMWVGGIVGLLSLSIVVHGVLVFFATTDPSFAVEPDYELRAAHWDDERAALASSAALGWTADVTLRPGRARYTAEVAVSLADAAGGPIEDAVVHARMFHNARAADAIEIMLDHRGTGMYDAILPARQAGIWIVELTAERGTDTWYSTVRRTLAMSTLGAAP